MRAPDWLIGILGVALLLVTPTGSLGQGLKLGAWRFDSADLSTEDGTKPKQGPVGDPAPEWDGKALRFGARVGKALVYPRPEGGRAEGRADGGRACVRFWYRPDWSSRGVGDGQGPGEWVRLMVVGDRERNPEDGWWEVSIVPEGTALEFSSSAGRGEAYTNRSGPVTFQAGVWTELLVNVFPGQLSGFKDGKVFWNEHPARPPSPGDAAWRRGLVLGSRLDGSQAARGALDEVEWSSRALGRVETGKTGFVMSAAPAAEDGGLELRWRVSPGATLELQRADGDSTQWTTLARPTGLQSFVDTNATAGTVYGYRLLTNGAPSAMELTAGRDLPPVDDRGEVVVLVDETVADDLAKELKRLEGDLVGDGWRVFRRRVPRHDDEEWSRNTNAVQRIRAMIQDEWRRSGETIRCVYLVGHVAIPYSGMSAEDGHTGRTGNHLGAWPSDQYYGDMDGVWTDRMPYPAYVTTPTLFAITRNEAGDGKFDTEWVAPNAGGQVRLEAAFGRVDFAGMPAFGRGRKVEVALLRQYLDKVHRYRLGEMPVTQRAVVLGTFGNYVDDPLLRVAFRSGSRLFGFGEEAVVEGDLFDLGARDTAAFGFQSGAGNLDRIRDGLANVVTTSALTDPGRQARVAFVMLLGSWFGDWAAGENNILRAVIGSRDYGLASIWVRRADWRFDPLTRGGTLGDAQVLTANTRLVYRNANLGTMRTLAIMGDPTLSLQVTQPPERVRGERSGGSVRLTWQADREVGRDGFRVYRSTGGAGGAFSLVGTVGRGERSLRDSGAPADAVYQVRAAELVVTGSGSYTNLSQGVFWPESP